jgi:hypothetical protein
MFVLLVSFVHFQSCDLRVLKRFTAALQGENSEKSKNFEGLSGPGPGAPRAPF